MNASAPPGKAVLRAEALSRRDALPAATRSAAALAIAELVPPLLPKGAEVIGTYLPIRSEVDPAALVVRLMDLGLRLAAPAIVEIDHLEFRALSPGAPLEPQGLGTFGPGPSAPVLLPDVLLVPLAAFDRAGHRLGYGRGFYDRAIARLREKRPRLVTIGLAFAAQEIESVPTDPFDVALDAIVTERETVIPKAG